MCDRAEGATPASDELLTPAEKTYLLKLLRRLGARINKRQGGAEDEEDVWDCAKDHLRAWLAERETTDLEQTEKNSSEGSRSKRSRAS